MKLLASAAIVSILACAPAFAQSPSFNGNNGNFQNGGMQQGMQQGMGHRRHRHHRHHKRNQLLQGIGGNGNNGQFNNGNGFNGNGR